MERPQPDAAWRQFEHSGSVADYLSYRNAEVPGGGELGPGAPGAAAGAQGEEAGAPLRPS